MSKKRLHSLDPREYEHPLDREALDKLESIPGVKPLIKKVYKEFLEKSLFIDNFGSNVLITKDNCSRVNDLLIEDLFDYIPDVKIWKKIKVSEEGSRILNYEKA